MGIDAAQQLSSCPLHPYPLSLTLPDAAAPLASQTCWRCPHPSFYWTLKLQDR